MSDDDPPTEPVRFTIVVHAGWSVDPPELWELVFPRCSFCGRPLRGACVRVGQTKYHANCYERLIPR